MDWFQYCYLVHALSDRFSFQVARWKDDYGIDGIDLDLEEGAGSQQVHPT
jgi:hypothetical protein